MFYEGERLRFYPTKKNGSRGCFSEGAMIHRKNKGELSRCRKGRKLRFLHLAKLFSVHGTEGELKKYPWMIRGGGVRKSQVRPCLGGRLETKLHWKFLGGARGEMNTAVQVEDGGFRRRVSKCQCLRRPRKHCFPTSSREKRKKMNWKLNLRIDSFGM